MSKKVTILRGIPGAGKSTWFEKNFLNEFHESRAAICSADDFFKVAYPKEDGSGYDLVYKFDPTKLGEAHKFCMSRFLHCTKEPHLFPGLPGELSVTHQVEEVVVDNTNIRLWEFSGYVQVARARGYDVEVVQIDCDPEVAAARCVHGVPAKKIRDMWKSMERVPKSWDVTNTLVRNNEIVESAWPKI